MRVTTTPTCRPVPCIGRDRELTIAIIQGYGRTMEKSRKRAARRAWIASLFRRLKGLMP